MATKTRAGQLNTAYVPKPLLTRSVRPQQFGTQDYVVTVVSASRFYRSYNGSNLDYTTLSGHCYYDCPSGYHLYQQVQVPAGAVIDYIGVNTSTTVDAAMGFTLHFRDHLGGSAQLVELVVPGAANFSTDFVGPLGIQFPTTSIAFSFSTSSRRLAAGLTQQFFGYFEVWWRRTVSDPPATPTFGDVPRLPSVLPVHRGAGRLGHHRRLRRRVELLPGRRAHAGPDGGVPLQGARPALAELSHRCRWNRAGLAPARLLLAGSSGERRFLSRSGWSGR